MIKKYPNIILLGAPASGKGTLAADLVKECKYKHLSTGDMFRTTAKENTPLGKKVKVLMTTGNLIPDKITNEMAGKFITKLVKDKKHFILDGYPRTKNQAEYLEKLGKINFLVIFMDIPWKVAARRILGRRSCPKCGAIYNVFTKKPKKANICDKCNTTLVARKDDTIQTAQNRFKVYMNLTEPLIKLYKKQKILKTIKIDEHTDVLKETLKIISKWSS